MAGRAGKTVDTRQALLAAGEAGFARRGFRATSVRDVATAARVHPALVRYHFGSKRKLYDAVVDSVMAALQERLVGAALSADQPSDIGWRVLEAYDDYLATERALPRIVVRALIDSDPQALKRIKSRIAPLFEQLRALMLAFDVPQRERLADAVISIFGALVVPSLYGPLLEGIYGEPLNAPAARTRRRAHLKGLPTAVVNELGATTVQGAAVVRKRT